MVAQTSRRQKKGRSDHGESPIPLYQSIVRELQSEIARGVYPVGTSLPSELVLMERFHVSRHTVRSAVRALQDAGLVKSHQGLGTIVQGLGQRHGYIHKINEISDLFPVVAETRHDPVDGRLVELPPWADCFSGLDRGRAWIRITGDRRKPGADHPFNELEVYVAARFAGVGRMIGPSSGSIYALLEGIYGETISEVEQVVAGFTADGERGARIGLKKGEIGIEVKRIHRVSSDNEVGIVSFNRYPVEEYSFSMVLRRSVS